ncbi:DMT family transporter [Effusibacillus consociatus]|uniref:DMT family transporter n=1 Tax=Effusibacillus consociatus TaxID=1117041 RepID=A0ABV9Q5U5_9BACL
MGKYRAWLLLVFCNLFWAGNYVFGKYVIEEVPPLWITFSRWLLALFLLFPIAWFLEKPDWKKAGQAWLPLVGMGILGGIGYNLLLYSALEYTTATNAALVSALNPAVIVLFSVLLLGERISTTQFAGFVVSLVGVLVILTKGSLGQIFDADYNRGDLLMVASVVVWTFYSIIGKRLGNIPPITATAVSTLFAVLIMAPFALAQGIDLTGIGPLAVTGILYMVIFPSVGSFVFWNMSVRAIGASQAGIFLNFIPVFTAIISVILGEEITGTQIWGGLLVFAGVYLTSGMLDRRWTRAAETYQKAGSA